MHAWLIGEFVRVKTNGNGEAFSLNVDFRNPVITEPGVKYSTSFYTLFNCPKNGCDLAQDEISVSFKEGINGVYKKVYTVVGKDHDDRWAQNTFNYVATNDRIYVCFTIKFMFAVMNLYKSIFLD